MPCSPGSDSEFPCTRDRTAQCGPLPPTVIPTGFFRPRKDMVSSAHAPWTGLEPVTFRLTVFTPSAPLNMGANCVTVGAKEVTLQGLCKNCIPRSVSFRIRHIEGFPRGIPVIKFVNVRRTNQTAVFALSSVSLNEFRLGPSPPCGHIRCMAFIEAGFTARSRLSLTEVILRQLFAFSALSANSHALSCYSHCSAN